MNRPRGTTPLKRRGAPRPPWNITTSKGIMIMWFQRKNIVKCCQAGSNKAAARVNFRKEDESVKIRCPPGILLPPPSAAPSPFSRQSSKRSRKIWTAFSSSFICQIDELVPVRVQFFGSERPFVVPFSCQESSFTPPFTINFFNRIVVLRFNLSLQIKQWNDFDYIKTF